MNTYSITSSSRLAEFNSREGVAVEEIVVTTALPSHYGEVRSMVGDFFDAFTLDLKGDEILQLVHDGKKWHGLLAWATAFDSVCDREHFIGWHDCQRAERIHLITNNRKFFPYRGAGTPLDLGKIILQSATAALSTSWENWYNFRPLLAESKFFPGSYLYRFYEAAGWVNCSKKNPNDHSTCWVQELVPTALQMLKNRRMEWNGQKNPPEVLYGLLPISNELLKSLKNTLKSIDDPRSSNGQYPLESILSILFLAILCGYNNCHQIAEFGVRLSSLQAEILELPFRKNHSYRSTPGYYVYYDLLRRLDMIKVVETLITWLEKHESVLPHVLSPKGGLISETLTSVATIIPPSKRNR